MKRQRGRGRKSGNPGNRSLESNGPDVKIRGTAAQIYEKYVQYARDAQTSGDRVKAENMLQHAEHYYRLMAANAPKQTRVERDNEREEQPETEEEVVQEEESVNDPLKVVDESEGDDAETRDASADTPQKTDDEAEAPKPKRRRTRRKPPEEAGDDKEARSALDALAEEQAAIADN